MTELESSTSEPNQISRVTKRIKTGLKEEDSEKEENDQIQKKLKGLERDYERLCSQMLTVESAKKIAKQTSRYYNKKP